MQINCLEAAATIFSRVKAPPPPLTSCKCSFTSSAPSIYKSNSPVKFKSITSIPSALSLSSVTFELATAPFRLTFGNNSMRQLTVLPVPTPKIMPDSIYFNASAATACFCCCCVLAFIVLIDPALLGIYQKNR